MATMNTFNPAPGQGTDKNAPKKMSSTNLIMMAVIVVLGITFFFMRHNMVEMNSALTEEKDSLANELRKMAYAYDTLRTTNDTLNAGLEQQKEKIVKLLEINASNTQLIKKYKK